MNKPFRRLFAASLMLSLTVPNYVYALRQTTEGAARAGLESALISPKTGLEEDGSPVNDVFEPDGSTRLFQELIRDYPDLFTGKNALDLGTGQGDLAFAMARVGAQVVAVDSSASAIELLQKNLTPLEDPEVQKITAGQSDLYADLEKITGQKTNRFEVIVFNNPIHLKNPQTALDATVDAGADGEVVRRALWGLPEFLTEDGDSFFLVVLNLKKSSHA